MTGLAGATPRDDFTVADLLLADANASAIRLGALAAARPPSTTVTVFRCVSALSLSVMRGAGVWLPCVTSFPGRGGYPGPVPAMSRAL